VPADVLAEDRFKRQVNSTRSKNRLTSWTRHVHFASGWQYADPDPTPATRQARREAAEEADRERETQRRLEERKAANRAALDALARARGAA
jgi:hypothetical protein